jgi:hypothetical protein
MVLSNGTKFARNQQSISNRTNVCGGPKKAGTASGVGYFMQSNPRLRRAATTVPREKNCNLIPGYISSTTQTQRTGYRATLGGI